MPAPLPSWVKETSKDSNRGHAMSLQIRRVVTGHDSTGRARVKIDEMAQNVISNRPGASSCVVWSTDSWPIDNSGDDDPSGRKIGTTIDNGSGFRTLPLEPRPSGRNHRTGS